MDYGLFFLILGLASIAAGGIDGGLSISTDEGRKRVAFMIIGALFLLISIGYPVIKIK